MRAFVKGAPERIVAMCSFSNPEETPRKLLALAASMAERGFRVLAFAEGPAADEPAPVQAPREPAGLTILGFVGMIDPLRPGVRGAVASCGAAGITVCMITGDHPVTALAIARDLGFAEPTATLNRGDTASQTIASSAPLRRLRSGSRLLFLTGALFFLVVKEGGALR